MKSVWLEFYHFPKHALNDAEFQCSPSNELSLGLHYCLLQEVGVFISGCSNRSSATWFIKNRSCLEKLAMDSVNCPLRWNSVTAIKLFKLASNFSRGSEKLLFRRQFCNATLTSIGEPWTRELYTYKDCQNCQMLITSRLSE